MQELLQLTLTPEEAADDAHVKRAASLELGIEEPKITQVRIERRSIDARKREIKVLLKVRVVFDEKPPAEPTYERQYPDVSKKPLAVVVGAGPAGLFAALRLIELGVRPIVIERGKDVRNRRRDIALLNRDHVVNPESNYCFGEGGAGTFSDGKLYTRSDKRGNIRRILEIFVAHGAAQEILVEAHPHIGTNKLPQIIINMRHAIERAGGEIRFNTKLVDLLIEDASVGGVVTESGETISTSSVILATGHSARDIFELLHKKKIEIEQKPFALGVRAEHPQKLIDEIQYKSSPSIPYLPPASYSLVEQVMDRGVYSFCMCPGGIIAPCATSPGEIVTNGWSPSRRNNPYANSGIVVTIEQDDLRSFSSAGPLASLRLQQYVEKKAWKAGGETQTAPAQRLVDFVEGKLSADLPKCSYQPGIASVMLKEVLPKPVAMRLREAFKGYARKMRGYYTNEAVLVATESRTSSPVRIPRDAETLEHTQIAGLYPSGEGAGYAGGIVSAAMDGERCAERCAAKVLRA